VSIVIAAAIIMANEEHSDEDVEYIGGGGEEGDYDEDYDTEDGDVDDAADDGSEGAVEEIDEGEEMPINACGIGQSSASRAFPSIRIVVSATIPLFWIS
jgi:hypothetical protein